MNGRGHNASTLVIIIMPPPPPPPPPSALPPIAAVADVEAPAPPPSAAATLGRRTLSGKLLVRERPLESVPALEDEHQDVPVRAFLSPSEAFAHVATAGSDRARAGPVREGVLGLLAGSFIGLGFSLCLAVGGQMSPELRRSEPGLFALIFGSFGFPFGLTLCVVCGASLFTSNVGYMAAAYCEGRVSALSVLRVWVYSFGCNALGALALAQMYIWGDVFGGGKAAFVLELAAKKTANPFGVTLVRGVLCNFLVVLAVWQANAAQDVAGKAVAIFLPISAFVALGFEHCVANLFGLPLALMLQRQQREGGTGAAAAAHSAPVAPGAATMPTPTPPPPPPLTLGRVVSRNLVPVTLGNALGGGLFVATAYAFAYGAPGRAADAWCERQWQRAVASVAAAAAARRRRGAAAGRAAGAAGGGGGGGGSNGSGSARGLVQSPGGHSHHPRIPPSEKALFS